MKGRNVLFIAALFVSLLLVYGCGEDKITEPTVQELIDQGWAKFETGNYSGACADFNAAIGLSADTNEAYLGLGWAELKQGKAGLAEDAFVTFLSKTSSLEDDAKAGLALACDAQDKFDDVINPAEEVLAADPTWTFSHDSETNYLDVALVLAYGYYMTADFAESLQVVRDFFDPGFSVDTSTPEGRKQLADKLESLYSG